MSSIANLLTKIQNDVDTISNIKNDIKDSIINKGQTITNEPFDEYADKIRQIQAGSDAPTESRINADITFPEFINGDEPAPFDDPAPLGPKGKMIYMVPHGSPVPASWQSSQYIYDNFHDALTYSTIYDVIYVLKGTYIFSTDLSITTESKRIYGGFDDTGLWANRNPFVHTSYIDSQSKSLEYKTTQSLYSDAVFDGICFCNFVGQTNQTSMFSIEVIDFYTYLYGICFNNCIFINCQYKNILKFSNLRSNGVTKSLGSINIKSSVFINCGFSDTTNLSTIIYLKNPYYDGVFDRNKFNISNIFFYSCFGNGLEVENYGAIINIYFINHQIKFINPGSSGHICHATLISIISGIYFYGCPLSSWYPLRTINCTQIDKLTMMDCFGSHVEIVITHYMSGDCSITNSLISNCYSYDDGLTSSSGCGLSIHKSNLGNAYIENNIINRCSFYEINSYSTNFCGLSVHKEYSAETKVYCRNNVIQNCFAYSENDQFNICGLYFMDESTEQGNDILSNNSLIGCISNKFSGIYARNISKIYNNCVMKCYIVGRPTTTTQSYVANAYIATNGEWGYSKCTLVQNNNASGQIITQRQSGVAIAIPYQLKGGYLTTSIELNNSATILPDRIGFNDSGLVVDNQDGSTGYYFNGGSYTNMNLSNEYITNDINHNWFGIWYNEYSGATTDILFTFTIQTIDGLIYSYKLNTGINEFVEAGYDEFSGREVTNCGQWELSSTATLSSFYLEKTNNISSILFKNNSSEEFPIFKNVATSSITNISNWMQLTNYEDLIQSFSNVDAPTRHDDRLIMPSYNINKFLNIHQLYITDKLSDMSLSSTSRFKGSGIYELNNTPETDISGLTRPNPPSIGAYDN